MKAKRICRKLLVFVIGRWRDRYMRCVECNKVFERTFDGEMEKRYHEASIHRIGLWWP